MKRTLIFGFFGLLCVCLLQHRTIYMLRQEIDNASKLNSPIIIERPSFDNKVIEPSVQKNVKITLPLSCPYHGSMK